MLNRVEKHIVKHWIDKPKQNGRGETTAILTDVPGFRRVLEHALIFHAIVHEFHELDASIQKDTSNLEEKIRDIMQVVLDGIYRGDNSVDTNTGKIHSHFHLARATREYGSPMGFDANLAERGLKSWAKNVSKTARKCGDATFVTQTAKRVVDVLLLAKVRRLYSTVEEDMQKKGSPLDLPGGITWKYTRASCHMTFDLGSQVSQSFFGRLVDNAEDHNRLLIKPIKRKLVECHGDFGTIMIWKEILMEPSEGARHYVRAFHHFDEYGPFFDWVQVRCFDDSNEYIIGKVLLLYKFESEDYALVWTALKPTHAERRAETNISARWRMGFADNSPKIICVNTAKLDRCCFVFEHRKHPDTRIPITEVDEADQRTYIVDEAYERYAWALNFLDESRWEEKCATFEGD